MINPELSNQFMTLTTDGIFILKDGLLIDVNLAGKKMLAYYYFDWLKILDRCYGRGCELHSLITNCQGCEVKENFNKESFSISLLSRNETEDTFSASFTELMVPDLVAVTLRNSTLAAKTNELRQQKKLMNYVSQAHENERKKMSQELHDGLAQYVFSSLMTARKIKREYGRDSKLTKYLTLLESELSETLAEVKRLALDLRPSALDDLGLLSAIPTLVKRLESSTGMAINFVSQISQTRFSESIEINLFRILQEALTNSIKYADVAEIDVLLVEKDQSLVLEVIDQGKGFNLADVNQHGRNMGLLHLEDRAASLGGDLTIKSRINGGTQVKVEIPLRMEEKP